MEELTIYNKHKLMERDELKILSVDRENNSCLCDDGNEYPLFCTDSATTKELQQHLNLAKRAVKIIMEEIDRCNGDANVN